MDGKMLARLAAIVFVAIAITASLIEMSRKNEAVPVLTAPVAPSASDPLRTDLRRCQQMGRAALDDEDCLATWQQTRDRFLGRDTRTSEAR
ncbi:putative entry exclusion protein TrbK-alt [Roseibium aggregatum]|uniref:Entry exclusion protein TrbK-alt n=1 Tax=Roseibium aggregatum TaxID=187304 RepID=A0A939J4L5_9HYPH|nr:putative entry exclusion protein TrbK-alt [Roseibium aggregatum]MBN9673708.1 putative entry exclusion protein TrbK-alt [Roseibium aggregatum]